MSGPTLFDVDLATGDILPPRARQMLPCGRHERFDRADLDHIAECLEMRCPWCGEVERNAWEFQEVHGSPSGYLSGYCLAQRYAFERRAECVGCHSTLWGATGCRNSTCRFFDPTAAPEPAVRDWVIWFEACADGVHRLAPCGHCERCGVPLLSIVDELASRCPGHPDSDSPLRG
ncbi:hypothetical protein [Agromyces larvae]|uniref:Uncharacterized protein n=1 Tax=Agromyces larvae TaxID=2929802 RepID=A0ABY4BYE5_9MICO|nr:hypothetical protein [Agromyces larvae]UOE43754.1 hypothetical protein MTO99_16520 [Agromyces larvae]